MSNRNELQNYSTAKKLQTRTGHFVSDAASGLGLHVFAFMVDLSMRIPDDRVTIAMIPTSHRLGDTVTGQGLDLHRLKHQLSHPVQLSL